VLPLIPHRKPFWFEVLNQDRYEGLSLAAPFSLCVESRFFNIFSNNIFDLTPPFGYDLYMCNMCNSRRGSNMLEDAFGFRVWSNFLSKEGKTEPGGDPTDSLGVKASALVMPKLDYKPADLHKVLTKASLDAHLKIHKRYVDKTRELTHGTEFADMPLSKVVVESGKKDKKLFQNASQAWNHAFYWLSISPPGQDTSPTGALLDAVNKSYGSVDECRAQMASTANKFFGSGWLWIVRDGDTPAVITTMNAGNPLTEKTTPIACIDLWEHAYFLDYKDDRESYVDSAIKDLLNWGFADRNWQASES